MNHNDLLFNLYRIETNAVLADDIKETARTAGNILRRQSGAVFAQNVLDSYTVLLLCPDYVADEFGKDTYLGRITTPLGPEEAIKLARQQAVAADFGTEIDAIDAKQHADAYFVLAVFAGHLADLNTEV